MRIEITCRGFPLTDALRDSVNDHIERSLNRFSKSVDLIRVRLSDVNGPKGGEDKQCSLAVVMSDGKLVISSGEHSDLYQAIGFTCRKVKEAVRKERDRERKSSRENVRAAAWGMVQAT